MGNRSTGGCWDPEKILRLSLFLLRRWKLQVLELQTVNLCLEKSTCHLLRFIMTRKRSPEGNGLFINGESEQNLLRGQI
jgi:hypothetical protein